MEKKTILIISLITIIFSLVYILLDYHGIIRYIILYFLLYENYTKNYKNLDKIGKDKTIINLNVTPKQMLKLPNVIKSLLDQTVKVDVIYIVLPYNNNYQLPKNLTNLISILRCDVDNGVLNCLIPSIITESESTTKIITLGGNTIYGKDFIETLLEKSEKNPDKIIYENKNDVIDLNKGVVFSTSFFNVDFLNVPNLMDGNKWVNIYFHNFPKQRIEYTENYKSL